MTSFLSLAQRAILAHAKWCRKSYGLGLISPSRLSPAASHIFLKLNGIDDADMILPLGPGKKYAILNHHRCCVMAQHTHTPDTTILLYASALEYVAYDIVAR